MDSFWTILALFAAAWVFIFLEILTPMFGLLAAAGIAALVAAVWLTFRISGGWGVVSAIVAVLVTPVYAYYLVKYLPRSGLGRRLFLPKADRGRGEGLPEASARQALVGKTGTAETTLRPTGAVRVDGKRVIASAESGMIERGAAVRVIRASAMEIIVRRAEQAAGTPARAAEQEGQ